MIVGPANGAKHGTPMASIPHVSPWRPQRGDFDSERGSWDERVVDTLTAVYFTDCNEQRNISPGRGIRSGFSLLRPPANVHGLGPSQSHPTPSTHPESYRRYRGARIRHSESGLDTRRTQVWRKRLGEFDDELLRDVWTQVSV